MNKFTFVSLCLAANCFLHATVSVDVIFIHFFPWDKARTIFKSSRASDTEIREITHDFEQRYSYSVCPHTATGLSALKGLESASNHIFLVTGKRKKKGNKKGERYLQILP